jgi:hypothetical protein
LKIKFGFLFLILFGIPFLIPFAIQFVVPFVVLLVIMSRIQFGIQFKVPLKLLCNFFYTTTTMKNKCILHGECIVFRSSLPPNALPTKVEGSYKIVADSEVTGNHHVVDVPAGVTFYEADGVTFMQNEVPTQIRCIVAERHNSIELEPGTWEFGTQKEYDYIAGELVNVRD